MNKQKKCFGGLGSQQFTFTKYIGTPRNNRDTVLVRDASLGELIQAVVPEAEIAQKIKGLGACTMVCAGRNLVTLFKIDTNDAKNVQPITVKDQKGLIVNGEPKEKNIVVDILDMDAVRSARSGKYFVLCVTSAQNLGVFSGYESQLKLDFLGFHEVLEGPASVVDPSVIKRAAFVDEKRYAILKTAVSPIECELLIGDASTQTTLSKITIEEPFLIDLVTDPQSFSFPTFSFSNQPKKLAVVTYTTQAAFLSLFSVVCLKTQTVVEPFIKFGELYEVGTGVNAPVSANIVSCVLRTFTFFKQQDPNTPNKTVEVEAGLAAFGLSDGTLQVVLYTIDGQDLVPQSLFSDTIAAGEPLVSLDAFIVPSFQNKNKVLVAAGSLELKVYEFSLNTEQELKNPQPVVRYSSTSVFTSGLTYFSPIFFSSLALSTTKNEKNEKKAEAGATLYFYEVATSNLHSFHFTYDKNNTFQGVEGFKVSSGDISAISAPKQRSQDANLAISKMVLKKNTLSL